MLSHFKFTKQQRNGILLLLTIIIGLQCAYFFIDFSAESEPINPEEYLAFEKEYDSIKKIKLELSKPKLYPFNPNYISDFKGSNLGMTNEETDRLLAFRKQGKWINSAKQFQEVTQVSDSLLNQISPYFKFPDWVNRDTQPNSKSRFNKNKEEKQDLNKATAQQLQTVFGVGEVYAKRIVRFRNKFPGGFIADVQLNDVYGLKPEVTKRITQKFTVKTPRVVKKINVNTATVNDFVTVQHIDYDLANEIIAYRNSLNGFKSIQDLKKVNGFPVNKFEIIELYLQTENYLNE
ncbi:ComEA family DNA-binding protein [Neotamlana laminarinivorans]|uniref:Helix-hairpin-helix domain-containing protein n=1 Tax=Neotamlana laminarinivorans TaxID=2883124 RepID=A0A9X1I197_9FLAO|nr:helix-hairpin-helix domain-containing protein [Tamlana laminarinivorans]MCB4799585.1 helix-hairpin-helix domain-containing protein [Tamlana laminarinivorans]